MRLPIDISYSIADKLIGLALTIDRVAAITIIEYVALTEGQIQHGTDEALARVTGERDTALAEIERLQVVQ